MCDHINHGLCKACRCVSLRISERTNLCGNCSSNRRTDEYFLSRDMLPIWYKDNLPQFHIPNVLASLTYAEKMLIQRLSPFIPLVHIKNGVHGLSGHVCAFEQDVDGIANVLPRRADDVIMLKVLKTIRAEIGDDKATRVHAFRVNRVKVLAALRFLKQYNKEYDDIEIDVSALDWIIEGDEGSLDALVIDANQNESSATDQHDTSACTGDAKDVNDDLVDPNTEDLGPNPIETIRNNTTHGDNVKAIGYLEEVGKGALSKEDNEINRRLRESITRSANRDKIQIELPQVSNLPVSEYGETRIFARAFPWLFPGGIGDIKDNQGHAGDWGKRLLLYQDGRFAKDKFFGFFAMNYIVRHRNNSQGKFFVDTFQSNCPDTIEELQESIEKGETKFVISITYYNKTITGSSAYWFQKRSELYTWINHHVENGDGAPMFFITLSCAEYAWPDIFRLIKQRMELAGDNPKDCYQGSPKMSQIINDYAIVIQEYFQKRVEAWLETVGKEIFDIKHHWVRYEFAPGRGQIHAHMLAISNDNSIYRICHDQMQEENGKENRAKLLSEWAEDKFGLVASVDEDFDKIEIDHKNSPVHIRFTDLNRNEDLIKDDTQRLMKQCQVHTCSAFCMRRRGHE